VKVVALRITMALIFQYYVDLPRSYVPVQQKKATQMNLTLW